MTDRTRTGSLRNKWAVGGLGLLLIAILTLAILRPGCERTPTGQEGTQPAQLSIRYGQLPFASSVLTRTADQHQLYKAAGIEVTTVAAPDAPTIINLLQAPPRSGVDAGGLAITPIAGMIASGKHPVILATIYKSDRQAMLLTFERTNITADPATLRGKRVGRAVNTIGDIYLSRLLRKGGLGPSDVTLVGGSPPQLKALLLQGEVDSVILWDPFTAAIRREYPQLTASGRVPDRGAFQTHVDPELYTTALVVVTTADRLDPHREALKQMLQALIQAESMVSANPDQTRLALEQWLGVQQGDLAEQFRTSSYTVHLNPEEVRQWLRAELEWLKERQPSVTVPQDLSKYVDASVLAAADPSRVRQ